MNDEHTRYKMNNSDLGNKNLELHNKMREWLLSVGITNYTINEFNEIDVHEMVNLNGLGLDSFPFKFGCIDETFSCRNNKLTTLNNSPHTVMGNFIISQNQISSLENGPTKINGTYLCNFNQLKNLIGCPNEVGVLGCGDNPLQTFEGLPKKIKGHFILNNIDFELCKKEHERLINVEVGGEIIARGWNIGEKLDPQFYDESETQVFMKSDLFKKFLLSEVLSDELGQEQPQTKKKNKI